MILDNILMEFYPDESFNCLICDFGNSKAIGASRSAVHGLEAPESLGFSVRFTAPEVKCLQ